MGFQLPSFKKCCCCLSLRTGSLIIGYVFSVLTLIILGGTSTSLYKVITYVHNHNTSNTTETEHTDKEIRNIAINLYIIHGFFIVLFVYHFAISILLIAGVHLTNIKYLQDYFKAGLFLLTLSLGSTVLSTVFFHYIITLMLLKWSVKVFYCLIIVRSYYLELEEEQKPANIEMQNLYNAHRPSHLYA